ncbi:MAG: nuclear transport factor 2 family protein [Frankiaceae bacterium]|nr:nuclear transport factor 2 family protein [Frankiaceae bacterium]
MTDPADVDRAEVEAAFRQHWTVGCVEENWAAWPDRLTEDVDYVEHVYGEMRGREAVRSWIVSLMEQRADVHALLDWYVISGSRLILNMTNRYYHPDPAGAPFDFPGLTVLGYAGDGLFGYQEDYWSQRLAKVAYLSWAAAVEQAGGRGLDGDRFEQLERERKAQNLAVLARGAG